MTEPLDEFTLRHLEAWLLRHFGANRPDEAVLAHHAILDFLQEYPDMIEKGRSWPEILNLATREL